MVVEVSASLRDCGKAGYLYDSVAEACRADCSGREGEWPYFLRPTVLPWICQLFVEGEMTAKALARVAIRGRRDGT